MTPLASLLFVAAIILKSPTLGEFAIVLWALGRGLR